MKRVNVIRFCVVIIVVIAAWYFLRDLNPAATTLIALCIILISTAWFLASIFKSPRNIENNAKSWWRTIWDGFWGI